MIWFIQSEIYHVKFKLSSNRHRSDPRLCTTLVSAGFCRTLDSAGLCRTQVSAGCFQFSSSQIKHGWSLISSTTESRLSPDCDTSWGWTWRWDWWDSVNSSSLMMREFCVNKEMMTFRWPFPSASEGACLCLIDSSWLTLIYAHSLTLSVFSSLSLTFLFLVSSGLFYFHR